MFVNMSRQLIYVIWHSICLNMLPVTPDAVITSHLLGTVTMVTCYCLSHFQAGVLCNIAAHWCEVYPLIVLAVADRSCL